MQNTMQKMSFRKRQIALAVAAVGAASLAGSNANAGHDDRTELRDRGPGRYLAGDFHNHTTCSDGSISMQKLVKKSTDTVDTPWGLDWFVQAGHGGNGNRNCTLVEDATLSTPAYPFVEGKGPTTTWAASIGAAGVQGNTQSSPADAGNSTTPLSSQANPVDVALAVDPAIPVSGHRVPVGVEERTAVHRPGIGGRRPRAQLDER